jgi:hypothetical protein
VSARESHLDRIDPLEAELAALRPAQPSAELFQRVGRELQRRPGFWARAWFIGPVAAAACAAVVLLVWRGGARPVGSVVPVATTTQVPTTTGVADDSDLPALATYRRAWARSPAALDALLDRHASRSLAGGSGTPTAAGMTSSFDLIPH